MKIGFHGLDLPEGKTKYLDPRFIALDKKWEPKKSSPFVAEFIRDEFSQCDAIVIATAAVLDLLILDMDKLEGRKERTTDPAELDLAARCLALLETETPLCDGAFSDAERAQLRSLALLSVKPVVVTAQAIGPTEAIAAVLAKARLMFFFTAGKTEVHAWPVPVDSDIVTCAGKIHTDMARGFIRADVVAYGDYMGVHGLQEARDKGLAKVVERGYVVQDADVIEIRFSV